MIRSAAGPRGGDLMPAGPSLPGPSAKRGEWSRDVYGERTRGIGDALPEAGCEGIADKMPESLGGDGRRYD